MREDKTSHPQCRKKASQENPKKTKDLFYDYVSVHVLGGSGI